MTIKEALSFKSEVELGKEVRKKLESEGYTTYEEVVVRSSETCDLVCKKDDVVIAVEMKLDFNFKLLAQAVRWYGRANMVYIAVPAEKVTPEKVAVTKALGIGIIEAWREISYGTTEVHVRKLLHAESLLLDEYPDKWNSILIDEHAHDAEAGCQNGNRSTPFSRTVDALRKYCADHPEATLNEALLETPTHYSNIKSAYGSLMKYAKVGIIEKFWKDPVPAKTQAR